MACASYADALASYADAPPAYGVNSSEETAVAEAASPWRFDGQDDKVCTIKLHSLKGYRAAASTCIYSIFFYYSDFVFVCGRL